MPTINFLFRRLQTGGNPQPSSSLTTWRLTVRSLLAPKARIGVGLSSLPGADADIAQADQFVEPARSLAGRSCAYPGVQAGDARLSAIHSNRAAGRPVPPRVRPRATNADEEQSSVARTLFPLPRPSNANLAELRLHRSTARTCAGAA